MEIARARCNGTYGNQYLQILDVSYGQYNVETNTTPITITYTNRNDAGTSGNYGYANPAVIALTDANGYRQQSYANSYTDYRNGAVVTLGTWNTSVKHNQDGKLNLNLTAYFSSESTTLSGGTVSGSIQLPDIPRNAVITSAPNFNDEENPTIQYSNPAGNIVSSLQARIENSAGTSAYVQYRDISKTSTNYTFEFTNEEREILRNATPNSNTLTVKFVIKTVIGNTTLWSTANRTMTIVNGNPVFNDFDFIDINPTTVTLTGGTHNNVKGYSTVRVFVPTNKKAEAVKSATMSKYRFVIDTQTTDIAYSDNDTVYGDINNSTIGVYNVYAIDSRNNSTLVTKMAENNIEYEPISFNSSNCSVKRNNGGVGKYAVLTLNGYIWNDDFGSVENSIKSVSYEYKKTTDTQWQTGPTAIVPTITNNSFSFEGQIGSADTQQDNEFELQSSYNFRITITDELSTKTIELTPMASAVPNISYADEGVGIMCDFDDNLGGLLQIGGKRIEYLNETKFYEGTTNFSFTAPFSGIIEINATWIGWGYDGGNLTLNISNPVGNATRLEGLQSTTSGHNTEAIPMISKVYYYVNEGTTYSFQIDIGGRIGGNPYSALVGILRREYNV